MCVKKLEINYHLILAEDNGIARWIIESGIDINAVGDDGKNTST